MMDSKKGLAFGVKVLTLISDCGNNYKVMYFSNSYELYDSLEMLFQIVFFERLKY